MTPELYEMLRMTIVIVMACVGSIVLLVYGFAEDEMLGMLGAFVPWALHLFLIDWSAASVIGFVVTMLLYSAACFAFILFVGSVDRY